MSVSKRQLLLFSLFLLVAVVVVNAGSLHSGARQPKDGLVCVGSVDLGGQFNQVVRAQRFCQVPRWNQTITHILALDRGINGKGGYAEIISGGINKKNVTIHMWSQRSYPLNFSLEVYAKPYW